jgi:hypothetical protein
MTMASDLLTYDNMMKFTQKYFDLLKDYELVKSPKFRDTMTGFFTNDFEIRWGQMVVKIDNRQEWIDHICGHADNYIAVVDYEPYPLRIMIDDKKKMAACWIKEEVRDTKTDEVKKVFLLNAYFEFKVEDNKIKFSKELISLISGLYASDLSPYKK